MKHFLVHQIICESAVHHAQSVAVQFGEQTLFYADLDQQSSALAVSLQKLGVAVGDRVALYLDKSIPAVISLLGILKAGACYVPIDPHAPFKRAAVILADSGASVLIGNLSKSKRVVDNLAADSLLTAIISIEVSSNEQSDIQWLNWSDVLTVTTDTITLPTQSEQDLCYILYTSGSTGTPKGVMHSHRSALSFIDWAQKTFALTPDDRVISYAPFHFDLSVFDLFVCFQAGATLILPSPGITISPSSYSRFLSESATSVLYATPALLIALLEYGELAKHDWQYLHLVLFAGDVMPPQALRKLMSIIPNVRYYNLYGPTETNVCTWFEVSEPPPVEQAIIPIGQACGNIELLIMDKQNQPVQDEAPGELWVRGDTQMSGYWQQAQQTAERLVTNPLQPEPSNDYFYRTGDLVQVAPDGNLIFLGRLDNMIKTRGYRVEPEEIERLLVQHPQITEAIIIAVEDTAGTLLKAIITGRGSLPTKRDLQKFCAEYLPNYMIPQWLIIVDELPKTSTGKLNRKLITTFYQSENLS